MKIRSKATLTLRAMLARSENVKKRAVREHPKSEMLTICASQAASSRYACTHSRYLTGGSPSGLRV